jgi:queuine/archaeosine tRNA-ribosyltransferase
MFSFEIRSTEGEARTGVLITLHGNIETPVFGPKRDSLDKGQSRF